MPRLAMRCVMPLLVQALRQCGKVVALVGMQLVGPFARPSLASADDRHGIKQERKHCHADYSERSANITVGRFFKNGFRSISQTSTPENLDVAGSKQRIPWYPTRSQRQADFEQFNP